MIRSFRTNTLCGLKFSRKRRWISSVANVDTGQKTTCPPSPLSDLSNPNYFLRSKCHVVMRNRLYHKQSRLRFFSTKDSGPKKDEVNSDRNHGTSDHPTIWDQLKSIPNIITISRLASTPVLCYWIINDEPNLAIVGCLLAGISDVLDGYIAKNYDASTVLGTYLDPFADKFFINSLAISLWYSGTLPTPLIFLWASKDAILLGGMGFYLYQEQRTINFFSNSIHTKPLTVTPSTLGKANTGLQFATLAVGILTPVVSPEILQPVVLESLIWVTGTSTIITTLSYATLGKGFKYTSKGSTNR